MDAPWLDLLNSDLCDYRGKGPRQDRLQDRKWLKEFILRWKLDRLDPAGIETRRVLGGLRTLLRRIVERFAAGKPTRPRDLADLNSYLAAGPVVCSVQRQGDGYRMSRVPTKTTRSAALSEIARSFAEVLAEGDPTRIRICENADCKWVFYDHSRSRTRRWCEGASACGNLLKVRRFRQRQKTAAGKNRRKSS